MNPVEEEVARLKNKSPPHKYVVEHGQAVESELKRVSIAGRQITLSAEITQTEQSVIKDAIQAIQPRTNECFSNALRLWEHNQRFKYAEGYASGPPDPDVVVEHAWAMLDGTKIVDPTANLEHYYGAVISSDKILEQNTGANFSPEGIICRRENRDFLREHGYTTYEHE